MVVGRKGGRRVGDSESDEGRDAAITRSSIIFLSSSDDEEANQDLSLEIIERAKCREEGHRAVVFDKSKSSEIETGGKSAVTTKSCGVVPLVDVNMLSSSSEAERTIKKKNNRKKNKKNKVKADGDPVVADSSAVDGDAAVQDEGPMAGESVIIEVNETPDNKVLKKLLRVPRYFDSEGCNWHFCYNCNEEGHTAANCNSEKRQKPCFVCGMVGHNPRKCTQTCSTCKTRGHATKDCPIKEKKSTQNSKICLRCGEMGHDMFACSCGYAPEDLKGIQCYVCKKFGHLCCVDAADTGPVLVSCYNCGQHGHSGVGCAKQRFQKSNTSSPTLCYKCGEEGHFARGCTNGKKVKHGRFLDVTSTPVLKKRKRDLAGSRSVPNNLGRTCKKKTIQFDERSIPARKSRIKGGWLVDDPADIPLERYNTDGWSSPSTSGKKTRPSLADQYSNSRKCHKSPKPFSRTSSSGSAGHYLNACSGRPVYNGHHRSVQSASRFGDSGGYF